jgi:hypothetical protein
LCLYNAYGSGKDAEQYENSNFKLNFPSQSVLFLYTGKKDVSKTVWLGVPGPITQKPISVKMLLLGSSDVHVAQYLNLQYSEFQNQDLITTMAPCTV